MKPERQSVDTGLVDFCGNTILLGRVVVVQTVLHRQLLPRRESHEIAYTGEEIDLAAEENEGMISCSAKLRSCLKGSHQRSTLAELSAINLPFTSRTESLSVKGLLLTWRIIW